MLFVRDARTVVAGCAARIRTPSEIADIHPRMKKYHDRLAQCNPYTNGPLSTLYAGGQLTPLLCIARRYTLAPYSILSQLSLPCQYRPLPPQQRHHQTTPSKPSPHEAPQPRSLCLIIHIRFCLQRFCCCLCCCCWSPLPPYPQQPLGSLHRITSGLRCFHGAELLRCCRLRDVLALAISTKLPTMVTACQAVALDPALVQRGTPAPGHHHKNTIQGGSDTDIQ